MKGIFFKLEANRVWRTYQGGQMLDQLEGRADAADSHLPEDWIGSVTEAKNPAGVGGSGGLAWVEYRGQRQPLRDLIASDPVAFLGAAHVARYGADPRILLKFIDSSIRLHLQVHPTAAFAQQFLGSTVGKTEAYYVLGARESAEPAHLYLGFRHPPEREQLRRMIETQAIDELLARMNRVPVRRGDVVLVPGGMPHALGQGLFLLELQEASDWVVRFEFERGGYLLPEAARFMGRGLDFCLGVFDTRPCSIQTVDEHLRCPARTVRTFGTAAQEAELIGKGQTDRFRMSRLDFDAPFVLPVNDFTLVVALEGGCCLQTDRMQAVLAPYERCLLPASVGEVRCAPVEGSGKGSLLRCRPPECQG